MDGPSIDGLLEAGDAMEEEGEEAKPRKIFSSFTPSSRHSPNFRKPQDIINDMQVENSQVQPGDLQRSPFGQSLEGDTDSTASSPQPPLPTGKGSSSLPQISRPEPKVRFPKPAAVRHGASDRVTPPSGEQRPASNTSEKTSPLKVQKPVKYRRRSTSPIPYTAAVAAANSNQLSTLEMNSLPIPDELIEDIFLRLPTPADLIRASVACTSFRRVVSNRSFLGHYRRLHPPPLLGLLKDRTFHPAVPPHPSAPAASAAVLAADFSFSFFPAPACDWIIRDSHDGRVLLDHGHFRHIAVCDPLHRRYLVLPQVPQDPHETLLKSEAFLIPADNDDDEEMSFGVAWMGQGKTTLFAFVFSSSTRQWRAVPPRTWIDLLAGSISTENALFYCRKSAYGCFYWLTNKLYWREGMKILVFDSRRMEFSILEPPPEAKPATCQSINVAMVEAGEARPGMFVLQSSRSLVSLHYTILQNNGESSSSRWQWEKTVSFPEGRWYLHAGSVGRYLLLVGWGELSFKRSYYTMDVKTFKFEKMCAEQSGHAHAYSNFPPFLLSSPTVSSGSQEGAEMEVLEQGMEAVRAEEPIDADDGGRACVSTTGDGVD